MGKSSGSLLLAYWLVCVFPLGCVHLEFFGQWAISSGVLSTRMVFFSHLYKVIDMYRLYCCLIFSLTSCMIQSSSACMPSCRFHLKPGLGYQNGTMDIKQLQLV